MSDQNLIIYKFNGLYQILEELDLELNFKITCTDNENYLNDSLKNLTNNLVISNKKFLVDNLLTFLANLNNRFFDIILSKFLPVNEIYFKLKK